MRLPFPWQTKPRDQKQETGNNCDVISGLQASRKTDFSVIFSLWANKFAKKWCKGASFYNKIRKCRRNLFSAKLDMTSQSFPVSCLWSRGFVPHRRWNVTFLVHQNTRKKKIDIEDNYFFLYWSVHSGDFIEQIKKICHIHLKLKVRLYFTSKPIDLKRPIKTSFLWNPTIKLKPLYKVLKLINNSSS